MTLFSQATPLEKELAHLQRREDALMNRRWSRKEPLVSRALEGKVPDKLRSALEQAFSKGFSLVFEKGSTYIEKTLGKAKREDEFFTNRAALDADRDRGALRSFPRQAKKAGLGNTLISTALGLGMGVFGLGIPDIPIFTAMIFKSLYEIAMSYGYKHDSDEERIFILMLIRGAMSSGDEALGINGRINRFIDQGSWPEDTTLEDCESAAAAALSEELLYIKFIQGLPVVGIVGGAANAVYMERISGYADLKYHRRFLLGL